MNKHLLIYGIFLIIFSFFTYLFIDPNLIYLNKLFTGFAYNNREAVTIIYFLLILIFFVFYRFFYKRASLSSLKRIIFISVLLLFISYPAMLSFDIFNYIFTSKVLFFYQENPYVIMPIEFIKDPLLLFTHAPNKVALYGPFWILITGMPFLISSSNFIFTLFSFKFFAVVFYLGISYLIFKLSSDPKKVAFFALNPLVLIETLVSGHNDAAMMFFALSSFYFLKNKKYFSSSILIIASILIKYATIFLFPVFLYYSYLKLKNRKINWDKIFMFSSIMMLIIFFLSAFRGEIYPWYAIWFITFIALIPKYKMLRDISILLSFVLLLRYIPFMYLGTYFGPTPAIKIVVTFVPLIILIFYYLYSKRKIIVKSLLK